MTRQATGAPAAPGSSGLSWHRRPCDWATMGRDLSTRSCPMLPRFQSWKQEGQLKPLLPSQTPSGKARTLQRWEDMSFTDCPLSARPPASHIHHSQSSLKLLKVALLFSHFTDVNTQAQRVCMTSLRSHSGVKSRLLVPTVHENKGRRANNSTCQVPGVYYLSPTTTGCACTQNTCK